MSKTWNFSKKDEINADSTKALQELKGEVIKVTGIELTEGVDNQTGEVKEVAFLKTEEYGIVSTISKTVLKTILKVIDYVEEEDLNEVEISVESGISKDENEFIMIKLV